MIKLYFFEILFGQILQILPQQRCKTRIVPEHRHEGNSHDEHKGVVFVATQIAIISSKSNLGPIVKRYDACCKL